MKQYHELLQKVLDEGILQNNRTGIPCYSIIGEMLSFDMNDGFPAITTKKLAFNAVKGELLGFIRGCTNVKDFQALGCNVWDLNANAEYWLKNPANKGDGDLGCIYGAIWRDYSQTKRKQPKPKLREGLLKTYLGVGNGSNAEGHPLKKTWEGMMARCYDPKSIGYKDYGARGVFVCDDWLEFSKFEEDAVLLSGWEYRKNAESFEFQLDKDLKGNGYCYSKESCCWLSAKDNVNIQLNRTYVVEKGGVEYSFTNIVDFCKDQGIEAKNFSDLWTGNKNAKTRGGFRLVSVSEPKKEPKVIDQLANALHEVMYNPTSRRIKVEAWNPAKLDQMALPPCHTGFQLYVDTKNNELSMTMNQRSCDMFLGVPFNIASYALLLHLIAEATGYKPRHLKMFLTDVHIYENHVEQVKEQLSRTEFPLCKLKFCKIREGESPIEYLEVLEPDDIWLENYESHPAIKAPMAV